MTKLKNHTGGGKSFVTSSIYTKFVSVLTLILCATSIISTESFARRRYRGGTDIVDNPNKKTGESVVVGNNCAINNLVVNKHVIPSEIYAKCKYVLRDDLEELEENNISYTQTMTLQKSYLQCNDKNIIQLKANMNEPLNKYINKEILKKEEYKNGLYLYVKGISSNIFGIFKCLQLRPSVGEEVVHITHDNIDSLCIKSADKETIISNPETISGDIEFISGKSPTCAKIQIKNEIAKLTWSKSNLLDEITKQTSEAEKSDETSSVIEEISSPEEKEEEQGPVNNIPKVKEVCGKIDVKELETIQGLSIASSVTSGIGAVGGVAGAITSGLAINKKESKGLDIASTITSAIGGATSTAGAVTSGIAAAKLKEIIDNIKKCKEEVSKLQ
jgi:hypothetical protein